MVRHLASVSGESNAQPIVHVGARIRSLREAQGWSQETLAAKAGLTRNTVAAIEREPLPVTTRLCTLLSLMEAFDLPRLETLFGDEMRSPSQRALGQWVGAGRPTKISREKNVAGSD